MFLWYFRGDSDLPLEDLFSLSFLLLLHSLQCFAETGDGRGRCFTFFRPHRKQFQRMSCSSEHAQTQLWRQPSKSKRVHRHAQTRTHKLRSSSPSHSFTFLPGIVSQMFWLPGRPSWNILDKKKIICEEFYLEYFSNDLTEQLRKCRLNQAFRPQSRSIQLLDHMDPTMCDWGCSQATRIQSEITINFLRITRWLMQILKLFELWFKASQYFMRATRNERTTAHFPSSVVAQ